MASAAPLADLRVLELATGIAGPWTGRLLSLYGASVVKVEPDGGDPARRQPVDDVALTGTSPLYTHLNAGKRNVAASASDLDELIRWADIVVTSSTSGDLARGPFARLRPPRQTSDGQLARLVNLTAWGPEAENAGEIDDELLVQAATGFLGFNRDVDQPPLRLPGWQSQYAAGTLGAVAGLAALRTGASVTDVTWLGALLTATELCYGDALHCERPRTPVGAHPPTAFPSGALPCKDGFVTPGSLRPVDWEMQCLFYGIPEWIDDPDYALRLRRPPRIPEIWDRIKGWYAERTKREIFQHALDSPWAVGMVMTPLDALADEHLTERGFLARHDDRIDATPGLPIRPVVMAGLPVERQEVAQTGAHRVRDVVADSDASGGARTLTGGPPVARRPLADVRIVEMTISWAGPYVGNVLAPLGAQIIKIESRSPFDGFRAQRPYDHGMAPGQEAFVEDNRFFEAGGLFNAVNKGKKDCVVSLRDPDGRAAFLELLRHSDALVANFSAHVLPDLGLDWESIAEVNPALVVVRAPAFGASGPYSSAAGYGSIVEAMGGLGHRQGYDHEGARISNIYFPDPIAGMHIATAVMVGLERAARTGSGGEIDLSHQETSWLHNGEALVLAGERQRDVGRMGNREPGAALAAITETTDGWLAVVASDEELDAASTSPDEVLAAIAARTTSEAAGWCRTAGLRAVPTLDPWSAPLTEPLRSLLDVVEHPVTGPKRHLGSPFIIDGSRAAPVGPAPLFDQHTDEIFTDVAGLSAEQVQALRDSGAIGGSLPRPADIGLRYD